MAGYPNSEPPAYDDHDFENDDDLNDNNVFQNEGYEEPVQRRYKKKKDDKKSSQGRERSSSASSVRVQLNRLSQQEVDDAKMESVFGQEAEKEAKRNSMRVNPLYDQNGAVTVSSTEAQKARSSSTTSYGADEETAGSKSKRTFKKSKGRDTTGEQVESGAPEPKIGYSQNFRFKGPAKQNGTANGGPKKITTTGRIMPSRISRNAIPGSQIMASLSGKERPQHEPEQPVVPPLSYSDEVEASQRRSEIRRKWRLVVALILIILVFALILVVVLYFAARGR